MILHFETKPGAIEKFILACQ